MTPRTAYAPSRPPVPALLLTGCRQVRRRNGWELWVPGGRASVLATSTQQHSEGNTPPPASPILERTQSAPSTPVVPAAHSEEPLPQTLKREQSDTALLTQPQSAAIAPPPPAPVSAAHLVAQAHATHAATPAPAPASPVPVSAPIPTPTPSPTPVPAAASPRVPTPSPSPSPADRPATPYTPGM